METELIAPHDFALPKNRERGIDASDFPKPAPGTNGTLGRNTFRGPRNVTLDLSLSRQFAAGRSRYLQVRLDIYNALNNLNLFLPNSDLSLSNCGKSTQATVDGVIAAIPRRAEFFSCARGLDDMMRRDDELDKAWRFHVDQRVADYIASGLTPEEARRRAALEFGGITQVKEAIRDQDSWRVLDGFLRDLRFAVRSLRRTPIFALTAALVLGLGIGANATVFTIVNTLLLRPLPFERADDVVQVRRRTPFGSSGSFPMHDYLALTTQRSALSALAILDVISAGRYTLMTRRCSGADQRMPRQRGVLRGARRIAGAWPIVHERR